MFWGIPNLANKSPVESILENGSFTLEELFDEDEIIQECRALNTRLITFLCDKNQVEKMLRFIIEELPQDMERAIKFPFIACEIFTSEVDVILNTLVENEELMDLLFSFLLSTHSRKTLVAGYFSKIIICLMSRKSKPLMRYIHSHQDVLGHLVDMIGTTSIMEVLVRLVGADDNMHSDAADTMEWLADTNLLEMIVDQLNSTNLPEVHANAAETLCTVTRNPTSAFALKMSSPSFIKRIFSHALEDHNSKSCLVHSLSVCISLLSTRSSPPAMSHYLQNSHFYDPITANPEIISGMLLNLGDLLKLLDISSDDKILPTTYGHLRPPLGKHRLKIVEFISVLLRTGNEESESELVRLGAIDRMLDLFFEYPFNNMLHHHVESIIMSCLGSKSVMLTDHLFQQCDLVGKLISVDRHPFLSSDSEKTTSATAGRLSPRIGSVGHITRIANKLVQLANVNGHVHAYLQGNNDWVDWEAETLVKRNMLENVYQWSCGRPTVLDRARGNDDDELHEKDFDVTALANNLSLAFRYGIYDQQEDPELVNGSIEHDDEDEYFDDDSAEVVISALRLGDPQDGERLFSNSNWFTFQEEKVNGDLLGSSLPVMVDIMDDSDGLTNSGGSSSSDDEVVVGGEDDDLDDTAASHYSHTVNDVAGNGCVESDINPALSTESCAGGSNLSLSNKELDETHLGSHGSDPGCVDWQERPYFEEAVSNGNSCNSSTYMGTSSEFTAVSGLDVNRVGHEVSLPNGDRMEHTTVSHEVGGFGETARAVSDVVESFGVKVGGTKKSMMDQDLNESSMGEAGLLKNLTESPRKEIFLDANVADKEFGETKYWHIEQEAYVIEEKAA